MFNEEGASGVGVICRRVGVWGVGGRGILLGPVRQVTCLRNKGGVGGKGVPEKTAECWSPKEGMQNLGAMGVEVEGRWAESYAGGLTAVGDLGSAAWL